VQEGDELTRQRDAEAAVVRHGLGLHVFLWTALPLAGAGVGWLLAHLPVWVRHLPVLGQRGVVEVLADLSGVVLTIVLTALGAVAGGVFALMSYDDMVTVEVTPHQVTMTRAGKTQSHPRAGITAVFLDGKDLVLVDEHSAELARVATDHKPGALMAAFTAHDYPWRADDPFREHFQRWIDGAPGLEPHANAILRTRQAALDSDDSDDAAELRGLLAERGIIVRDVGGKQHWRTSTRHAVGRSRTDPTSM
jgi:hypothetical protein